MCNYATPQTVELLDRVIGAGIYDIETPVLLPTIKAFLTAESSRPKILLALLARIKTVVDEVTLSELCDLARVLEAFEGQKEGMYDLIEPYILNKAGSMTEGDLVMALHGFYNPHLSKRYEILDVLESMLLQQIDNLSPHLVGDLLDFYSDRQMGSRVLIEALKSR